MWHFVCRAAVYVALLFSALPKSQRLAPRQRHVVLSVASDVTDGNEGATLLDAVRSELAAADMTNSALGQLALLLAAKLSDTNETAAGTAAVSKELSRVMTAALRGVRVSADPLGRTAETTRRETVTCRAELPLIEGGIWPIFPSWPPT